MFPPSEFHSTFGGRASRCSWGATIYSDSASALQAIANPMFQSGQRLLGLVAQVLDRVAEKGQRLEVAWIPGHDGIEGNEGADRLAKEATEQGATIDPPVWRTSYRHRRSSLSLIDASFGEDEDVPSSQALQTPGGPVTSKLKFYQPPSDGSTPFYAVGTTEAQSHRNYGQKDHPVLIQDIRGHESAFTLDKNAFMAATTHLSTTDNIFINDEKIRNSYYPEVEQLLCSLLNVIRVYIFDHTVRRSGPLAKSGPVYHVHIDQTPSSARDRVGVHLFNEAEELLKGRVRIINVWRPINGPVYGNPLAFADSSTVLDRDLIAVRHVYPEREGQTFALKYNTTQKWYYWSGMRNNERILLLCYDSLLGGRVPHSAFIDHRTPAGAPGRESIEVRALVFG